MANILIDDLQEIKRQKDEYIIPENIKKDVTVFDVTGTLESGYNIDGTLVNGTAKENISKNSAVKITTEKVINGNNITVEDVKNSKFKAYNHIISTSCKYIWSFEDKKRIIIRLDDDGNVISREDKADRIIESDDAFVIGVNEDDTLAWCFDIVDGTPKVKVEKIETGDIYTFYPTPVETFNIKRKTGFSSDNYFQGVAVNDSFYVLVPNQCFEFGFNRETNQLVHMTSARVYGNYGPPYSLYYDKANNVCLSIVQNQSTYKSDFMRCVNYDTTETAGACSFSGIGRNSGDGTDTSYVYTIGCGGRYLIGSNESNGALFYMNPANVTPYTSYYKSRSYPGLKYYDGTYGVGAYKIWKFDGFENYTVLASTTDSKMFCSTHTYSLSVTASVPLKYWFRDYYETYNGEYTLVRRVCRMVGNGTVTYFSNTDSTIAPDSSYGIAINDISANANGTVLSEFTVDTSDITEAENILRDALGAT